MNTLRPYITEGEIQKAIKRIAQAINLDFANKEVILVCILKGAVIFLSDLIRQLTIPVAIDFIAISSYGSNTESSGVVKITKDLDADIRGRHVIVVEDIVDTGRSLDYILRIINERKPASLRVAVLLSKAERREVEVPIDYPGLEIEDRFVVGYGLDFAEKYRNLPYIGILENQ